MMTITLEVPDELAARFNADPSSLPALVREAVSEKMAKLALSLNGGTSVRLIYQEIIDFLASGPALEQIVDFKISSSAQERLEDLVDKNREGGLTPAEELELNRYFQYRHVMILLKADARALSA